MYIGKSRALSQTKRVEEGCRGKPTVKHREWRRANRQEQISQSSTEGGEAVDYDIRGYCAYNAHGGE